MTRKQLIETRRLLKEWADPKRSMLEASVEGGLMPKRQADARLAAFDIADAILDELIQSYEPDYLETEA